MDFLDHTLEDFRQYLKENTESKNTVKNYVSDLRIFLIFLDSRHSPINAENFPKFLTSQSLNEFSEYLSVINPPATLNRRVSSVKKFFDYYMEHHPLPPQPSSPEVTFSSPLPEKTPVAQPEINSEPKIIDVDNIPENVVEPEQAPDSASSLLRLLPEEFSDDLETKTGGSSITYTHPHKFFDTYKIHVICIFSFIVGFVATMAIYPILYP